MVFGFYLGRLAGQVLLLPSLHRPSLDLRSLTQQLVLPIEVDIRGRQIVERLVVTLVVVVGDEVFECGVQLGWEVILLELGHTFFGTRTSGGAPGLEPGTDGLKEGEETEA